MCSIQPLSRNEGFDYDEIAPLVYGGFCSCTDSFEELLAQDGTNGSAKLMCTTRPRRRMTMAGSGSVEIWKNHNISWRIVLAQATHRADRHDLFYTSALSAQMLAWYGTSLGIKRCPRPCRARNATR